MNTTFILLRWKINDLLRKKPLLPALICLCGYLAFGSFSKLRAIKLLLASNRYYPTAISQKLIHKNLSLISELTPSLIDKRYVRGLRCESIEMIANRIIILKFPKVEDGQIEKGVLLISFTDTFSYFYLNTNLQLLDSLFVVVLEPSWSGYAVAEILFWRDIASTIPVVVQATEKRDYEFIENLPGNIVPVSFGASDWVNPSIFYPIEGEEKIYDCVYVANYNSIKRHHILFKALRKIANPDFKALLVCASWGHNKDQIHSLMDYYQVRDYLTVFESVSLSELNLLLNRSKVNMLLSLKEGSNRSVFEGFFAGTPAIVLKNNVGMNKNYINNQTGVLIDEEELAKWLLYFKENWQNFAPHKWAMENISPAVTTAKLEMLLEKTSRESGYTWTEGLFSKVNSPEFSYLDSSLEASRLETSKRLLKNLDNGARINQAELLNSLIEPGGRKQ